MVKILYIPHLDDLKISTSSFCRENQISVPPGEVCQPPPPPLRLRNGKAHYTVCNRRIENL